MTPYRNVFQFPRATADCPSGANVSCRPNATPKLLREAAKIVEGAAYAEAGNQPASVVSQLIMLAADLERLSQVIERDKTDD